MKEAKGEKRVWILYAVLSAVFAALTSILAKVGIEKIDSNLATAIRTAAGLRQIGGRSLVFLVLSGLATGASWLFYYKAIQMGEVSRVVPIDKFSVVITMVLAFVFLHEKITLKTALGGVLITAGTFVMIL